MPRIFTQRTYLIAQRLVPMRFGRYHAEQRRLEGNLFQSFGVGTHPQVTLPVRKSRMNLIGKTPVGIRQTVVESSQAIARSVKTRKATAIGMHPYRTVNIFVHMKRRTRTVCAGRLHTYHFRFQDLRFRIEMRDGARHFLLKPYFRVLIHIDGTYRRFWQTGRLIMLGCSGRYVVSEESIGFRHNHKVVLIDVLYRHDTGSTG